MRVRWSRWDLELGIVGMSSYKGSAYVRRQLASLSLFSAALAVIVFGGCLYFALVSKETFIIALLFSTPTTP